MRNEELIAAMRDLSAGPSSYLQDVGNSAADRIEALVKERDEALEWLSASQGYIADAVFALDKQEKAEARIEQLAATNEALVSENKMLRDAVYIDDLTVTMQASDRSKAMRAIGRALDFLNADMLVEAKTTLRAALKGDDHE